MVKDSIEAVSFGSTWDSVPKPANIYIYIFICNYTIFKKRLSIVQTNIYLILLWWQLRRAPLILFNNFITCAVQFLVFGILFIYASLTSLYQKSTPNSIYILSLFMQLRINIYLILLELNAPKFYVCLVILFWYIYYLDMIRNIIS